MTLPSLLSREAAFPSALEAGSSLAEVVEGVGAPEARGRTIRRLLAVFAFVLLVSAARFQAWPLASLHGAIIDFHDFYLASLLVHSGEIAHAYGLADLFAFQRRAFGDAAMMPWTYPPPFDLALAPLASLPIGLAYLVFSGSTFVAYLGALRRLAPDRWASVVALLAPAVVITLRCGQNGFLTGALIASAAMGLSAGRAWAGAPLGLMLIKPHLAVTVLLYALLTRRWSALAVAALVAGVSGLVATVALGPGIWIAFLGGVKEASRLLAHGAYPSFRMVSVYAMVRSLHLSAEAGAACQFVFAALALGATALAACKLSVRPAIGVAALAALMVSPYAYDYDLPIFGVGMALVWPNLRRFVPERARAGFYLLALLTQTLPLALSVGCDIAGHELVLLPSFGAVTLLAALSLSGLALWRASIGAPPADAR